MTSKTGAPRCAFPRQRGKVGTGANGPIVEALEPGISANLFDAPTRSARPDAARRAFA